MNEESKKRLIDWLGEKWHYLENDAEVKCACGEMWVVKSIDIEQHENRTFTTPDDYFAVFDKLVELGEWEEFDEWAYMKWDQLKPFNDLSRHLGEQSQWLHSKTDTGEYRLCWLVEEWKEGER
jgi:hypothetical protein